MITLLLILHSLVGVTLLGALTHQMISTLRRSKARTGSFIARYSRVEARAFTPAVAWLFVAQVGLGAVIYPVYRLEVRIPFEEMSLGWAVGLFELKEHFAALGLGLLPLYVSAWRRSSAENAASTHRADHVANTWILGIIVWWDFLIGHVLNNIRGLA